MKRKKRKLQLNRSTVRTLVAEDMKNAAGGAYAQTIWRCTSRNGTGTHDVETYYGCTARNR